MTEQVDCWITRYDFIKSSLLTPPHRSTFAEFLGSTADLVSSSAGSTAPEQCVSVFCPYMTATVKGFSWLRQHLIGEELLAFICTDG